MSPSLLQRWNDGAMPPISAWVRDRHPVIAERLTAEEASELAAVIDVDGLVGSLPTPTEGWLQLVNGRARPVGSPSTSDGLVDLGEVTRAYSEGSTLLLTKVHRRVPAIGELCRAIDRSMLQGGLVPSQRVGANLYVTPASSQGFAVHYDDHHVVIVQLKGEKQWKIYSEWIDSPIAPPSEPLQASAIGAPEIVRTLAPGDVLYVPSGFPHEATAVGAAPSLHLTLSIHVATWMDLAHKVLAAHPRSRRPILLESLAGGLATASRAFDDAGELERAVEAMRDEYVERLAPLPDGVLGSGDYPKGIGLETSVALRKGVLCRARSVAETIVLHVPGAAIHCDARSGEAIETLLSGRAIEIGAFPGNLTDSERMALARVLLAHGVLRPAPR